MSRSPPWHSDGKPKIMYSAGQQICAILKSLNAKFSDHFVGIADISEDGSAPFSSAPPATAIRARSRCSTPQRTICGRCIKSNRGLKPTRWANANRSGSRRPAARSWKDSSRFRRTAQRKICRRVLICARRAAQHLASLVYLRIWENLEAQFLATRGYAVVQVNYRGSGGRGKNFEDSGKLQMGTGMMQDMLDASEMGRGSRLHG